MEKHYNSAPPAGFAPPPSYDSQNAYPPNAYPSNAHPLNAYPPNTYPQNPTPPITYPPNSYPHPQNSPYSCPPPPPQSTNTVVITGCTTATNFGPNSASLTCPFCHHYITTKVETKATTRTHLIALLLCLCLCWPCCCCPYCIDSCQGKNHYCPHCNAFLGAYNN